MFVVYLRAVMYLRRAFVSTGRRDKSPSVFAASTTSAFNLFDCILYGPAFEMRVNGFVGGFVPQVNKHECF